MALNDCAYRFRLLENLIAVLGEPRYDIASEITAARRATARRAEAAAEMVPAS
jgi:hypothetical protein